METKKSKVTGIDVNIGNWSGKEGKTFYNHMIHFENNDKGIYASITPECTKFVIGQEHDYTKTPNGEYPDKIKPVTEGFSGGFKKHQNNKSFALSYSKDISVARINAGMPDGVNSSDTLTRADAFLKWLES